MSTVIASRPTPVSAVTATAAPAGRTATAVPDPSTLARWAAMIAADGIAAHEDRALSVAAAASATGLCPVLADVLADPREPAVARERAFGRLALAITLIAA